MAKMSSSAGYTDYRTWAKNIKDKATELRGSAERIAADLFSSGDLGEYLSLLSRLNHYDATNLLLILRQYPQATCLAGSNLWKGFLEQGTSVLKPEWRGKGIDLVAPFLEYKGDGDYVLTWCAVKQVDISQTNVTDYPNITSLYINDKEHLSVLIDSIKETIGTDFHRTVLMISPTTELREFGLPGQLTDTMVTIRKDLKSLQQLDWLVNCLCSLATPENSLFSDIQLNFANRCIAHCLYMTWHIQDLYSFSQSEAAMETIEPALQLDFLDYIQRTVRLLEDSISTIYCRTRGIINPQQNTCLVITEHPEGGEL